MFVMQATAIKTIANIGAGTMGHATALQFAMAGYTVNLLDVSTEALEAGRQQIEHDLETFNHTGMLNDFPTKILDHIHFTTDYKTALTDADFVIESVIEDMTIKQSVWQKVEQFVKPDAILATNTSGLDPTKIQAVLTHPKRFVVAHFMNPAQLMPLVEVVPGEHTAPEIVTETVALLKHVGKHPVPLKKAALGFVGNRIQLAVLREAFHIIGADIATPEAVDDIIKYSLGRRWNLIGPVASADLGGLDVFKSISDYLYADLSHQQGPDPHLQEKVEQGKLGLKTGEGFYDWSGETGQKLVQFRDEALLKQLKADQQENHSEQ